jgi:hypothetical protein
LDNTYAINPSSKLQLKYPTANNHERKQTQNIFRISKKKKKKKQKYKLLPFVRMSYETTVLKWKLCRNINISVSIYSINPQVRNASYKLSFRGDGYSKTEVTKDSFHFSKNARTYVTLVSM